MAENPWMKQMLANKNKTGESSNNTKPEVEINSFRLSPHHLGLKTTRIFQIVHQQSIT